MSTGTARAARISAEAGPACLNRYISRYRRPSVAPILFQSEEVDHSSTLERQFEPHTNNVASKTRALGGRTSLNICWDVETTVERTLPHFMPTPMLHVAVNIIGEHNELEESLAEPYIEEFEDISHVLEQAGLPIFQEPRSVINWGEVDNRRKYDETIPIRNLHLLRRAYAIMKAVRSALSSPAPGISCSHTSSTSPTPNELKRDAIAHWACR
jgi:hypothetical protein